MKATFDQKSKGSEGLSHTDLSGQNFPGQTACVCEGSEGRKCL